VTVDLVASELILPGNLGRHPIVIDAFARECILQGLDEIEMTFTYLNNIKDFESNRMASHAWLAR
jgi:3-isopropylmalate/(R)-2-methylmalate dehydratase small subunit